MTALLSVLPLRLLSGLPVRLLLLILHGRHGSSVMLHRRLTVLLRHHAAFSALIVRLRLWIVLYRLCTAHMAKDAARGQLCTAVTAKISHLILLTVIPAR